MNVLVTGHGADADAVNKARRTVPYQRLVLVSTDAHADEIAAWRASEALANVTVDVRAVDAADFTGALAAARHVLRTHERDTVHVHVAGGPNLVTSALLLASFETGADAFYCHPRGVSRLPVARSVNLADRFTPAERAVLRALPADGDAPLADVIARAGLPAGTVKGALLRLRKAGLVRATHERAGVTATGAHYREHFADAPEVTA